MIILMISSIFKISKFKIVRLACIVETKPPIPLDGDSAAIRNFGQNDTNHSRNGKSAGEAQ